MPYLRNAFIWVPVYVFFGAFIIKNFSSRAIFLIAGIILAFGIADYSSASILKPMFMRARPCRDLFTASYVIKLVNCGPAYSLPSAHAANHFAISTFLAFALPSKTKWMVRLLYGWAAMVAFAQVYVGVHYPLDVLTGALLGCIIGYWIAVLVDVATAFRKKRPQLS